MEARAEKDAVQRKYSHTSTLFCVVHLHPCAGLFDFGDASDTFTVCREIEEKYEYFICL